MRTVEDDELRHHLGVVDGKQPRYGPAPVVADETTSVVPWKEKARGRQTVLCYCSSWTLAQMSRRLLKHVSASQKSILFSLLHYWLPPSEDILHPSNGCIPS